MLICIDPGHGGSDPGSLGPNGRMEKEDNLTYAKELRRQFEEQRFDVLMTRESDIAVDLNARPVTANKARAALFISCHRNSAATATANGAEVWLHTDATSNMVQWAGRMADGFKALGFVLRATNNDGWPSGVKRGHNDGVQFNFAVNRYSTMPSMLIELGFMPNEGDNALFDARYRECCASVVKSSCDYLGIQYHTPIEPAEPDYKALYESEHALRVAAEAKLATIRNVIA